MRIEMTRTFPVPLKMGFDYIDDFKTWPLWYSGLTELIEPETAAWTMPGDRVRFSYMLLGRRLEGVAILEEKLDGELGAFMVEVTGLPKMRHEWHYAAAGTEAFIAKVTITGEDAESLFGKVMERMVLPRALEADLGRSLESLHEIFAAGLHEH